MPCNYLSNDVNKLQIEVQRLMQLNLNGIMTEPQFHGSEIEEVENYVAAIQHKIADVLQDVQNCEAQY
jgi:uncharacterized pyridoxal phosphate-containing UPF0001 family protein